MLHAAGRALRSHDHHVQRGGDSNGLASCKYLCTICEKKKIARSCGKVDGNRRSNSNYRAALNFSSSRKSSSSMRRIRGR